MDTRKLARIAALVVVLLFMFALIAEHADAAGKTGGDSKLAGKKGALGNKKTDESKMPKKWQMAVGVGSVFVAFVVIKWL